MKVRFVQRGLPARVVVVAALAALAALTACGGEDAPVQGKVGGCAVDADCALLDDDDACNGALRCAAGRCRVDPATVVVCDSAGDDACSHNVCAPADGSCSVKPRNDGLPCDDGGPCTLGDRCEGGVCVAGATDLCECHDSDDCADNGDLCDGAPFCDTAAFPHRCKILPATVVSCEPSEEACKVAQCDKATGACVAVPVDAGAACDDGDPCTANDACSDGACVGADNTCTCESNADCVDADANPCTGMPYCAKDAAGVGTCKTNPATVVSCSPQSDTACVKNTCLVATGACALVAVKDETPCDDGDACTENDGCVAGSCVGGVDTCKCTKDSDCAAQEDGNACNGTLFCEASSGACKVNPATVVSCQTVTDTDCAKNVCVAETGACAVLPRDEVKLAGCVDVDLGGLVGKQCLWVPAGAKAAGPFACDDGDACTVGEVCEGKACGGGKVTCACSVDADCEPQDDGDLCNGVLFCDKAVGACKPNPASVVYCSKVDDTACEAAVCDPKTGACALAPIAAGQGCDDGKPCTAEDQCDGKGICAGNGETVCDDGKACTVDVCEPGKGCVYKAMACDDGNVCTSDGCDEQVGQCAFVAKADGFDCDADGSGCTVGDACGEGVCKAGPAQICPEPTAPCLAQKCVSTGPNASQCVAVAKPDGVPCPDGAKSCLVGATCKAGACKQGAKPRLFAKLMGQQGGYARFVAVAPRPGGGVVAVGG